MRLIILFLLSARLMSAEVLVDGVVAVVGEEPILNSDLKEFRETFKIRRNSMPESEFQSIMNSPEKLLNKLIDEKIISQYIAEKDIKVTDEEIAQSINYIFKTYDITLPQLKAQLEREGTDFATFKEEKRKEIEVSKVLEYEIKRSINITEEDNKKYFKEKTGEDVIVTEYRLQAVLSSNQADVKKAYAELMEGESFDALAKTYSEDKHIRESAGDLGFFSPGSLIQDLREAVSGMSVGDVKGPLKVKTEKGIDHYLIKLSEVRNTENSNYTANKENYRRELMAIEINKQLSLWLERRRSESYVNINLKPES